MRPIDADALWTYIANNSACYHDCCPRASGKKGVLACIDEQPTIEPEVRHGRWIPYFSDEAYNVTNVFICSECEKSARFIMAYHKCEYAFCPHCGARMGE